MNANDFTQRPDNGMLYAKNTVPPFVITKRVTVVATLQVDGQTVFEGSYAPGFDGRITVDFADLYADLLTTEVPTTGDTVVFHTQFMRRFTASFVEMDARANPVEATWMVANSTVVDDLSGWGYAQWLLSNFLTNQPIEKPTNYESPEWLTFMVNGTADVKVRFYPKSGGCIEAYIWQGGEGVVQFASVNVAYNRLIRIAGTTPGSLLGYYDIVVQQKGGEATQRYLYEERTGREKYYCFVNALGGIDTLICDGANTLQPDTTHNIGRFGGRLRAIDDTDDLRRWRQQTGHMPWRWRNWIYELLAEKQAAMKYDPEADAYYGIVVSATEIAMADAAQTAAAAFDYLLDQPEKTVTQSERRVDNTTFHQSAADRAQPLHDDTKTEEATLKWDEEDGFCSVYDLGPFPTTRIYVDFDPPAEETAHRIMMRAWEPGSDDRFYFTPCQSTPPLAFDIPYGRILDFESEDESGRYFDGFKIRVSYYPQLLKNT